MNKRKVDPNKIVQFCVKIFNEYSIGKGVNIKPDIDDSSLYILQGELGEFKVGTHEKKVFAIPLKNGIYTHFSISFSLENVSAKRILYYLNGVSLQFFADNNLLFRAEWDNKEVTEHPQPHWHIEPNNLLKNRLLEKDTFSFFEEYLAMEECKEKESGFENQIKENSIKNVPFKYENFHFAMAASWHTPASVDNIELTEENLILWLTNCLNRICHQFAYIGYDIHSN